MKKLNFGISLFLLLCSCTTQNFVPPRPLQKGENELRFSLCFSLNRFSSISAQFSGFHGISDKDVIGISLNNFFLPNQISYAHYWGNELDFQNIQIHYNDLLDISFNPTYEVGFGLSALNGGVYNSIKLGFGYYATPLIFKLFGNSISTHKIVPIIGYRLEYKSIGMDIQLIRGMTEYYIHYYKDNYRQYPYSKLPGIEYEDHKYLFSHSEVDTIINAGDEYKITLKSKDVLNIASYPPYPDCTVCGFYQKMNAAYLASSEHKIYWVYWKDYNNHKQPPEMLELNMKKIINDYRKGEDLRLVEDTDITRRTINKSNFLMHDLFYSIGSVEYQQY